MIGDLFGWAMGSFASAFVFILIPWLMIGATSGYLLGQVRGKMAGASAAWSAVLGPVGWIITLFATSETTATVASEGFGGVADGISDFVDDKVGGRLPSAKGKGNDELSDDLIAELGFDPFEDDSTGRAS